MQAYNTQGSELASFGHQTDTLSAVYSDMKLDVMNFILKTIRSCQASYTQSAVL